MTNKQKTKIIENPFRDVDSMKKDRFLVTFPKEIGIQNWEVKAFSYNTEYVEMNFRCIAGSRTFKTLVELSKEVSGFDFKVELLDATGIPVTDIFHECYCVREVQYDLGYNQDEEVMMYVKLECNPYRKSYVHYTLDNGVVFGNDIRQNQKEQIEKRIEERLKSRLPIRLKTDEKKLGDVYASVYKYDSYGMQYLQKKIAAFLNGDTKTFAYRKSRQVGSTKMLCDLIELYVNSGKKVCILTDKQASLYPYKQFASNNVVLVTDKRHLIGYRDIDLVVFTENYSFQKTDPDIQGDYATIEPILGKDGKTIFEFPPFHHAFEADDNYLPWWLDDKKITGYGSIQLYKGSQLIETELTPEERVLIYEKNRDMFKTYQASFWNKWREDMEERLGGGYGLGGSEDRFRREFEV